MGDLTREQIEARIAVLDRLIENEPQHSAGWQMDAIAYRMALRALDAESALAAAREAMPTHEERVTLKSLVRGTLERPDRVWPNAENIIGRWLSRLDAFRAGQKQNGVDHG